MNAAAELRALLAQESELSEADCDRLAELLDQQADGLAEIQAEIQAELRAFDPLRALPQPASPAPAAWEACWAGIQKGTLEAPAPTTPPGPMAQPTAELTGPQNSSVALALVVGLALMLLMTMNLQTPPVLQKPSITPQNGSQSPGRDQPKLDQPRPGEVQPALEIQAALPPADLELRSDEREELDVEISMDFGEGYVAWPVVGAMSEAGASPVIWIEERKAR